MQLMEILNPYSGTQIQQIIHLVSNVAPNERELVKNIFNTTPYFDSINRERNYIEITDLDFVRPDLLAHKLGSAVNFGTNKNSRMGSGDEKFPIRLLKRLKMELGE
jgi:hypothetical protein